MTPNLPPKSDHFHVHIVHVTHQGFASASGHLHLLDDIIDNLELEATARSGPAPDDQSYFARRTFVYSLGVAHGLFEGLWAAQSDRTG
jgi:hypothetical protein